LPVNVAIVGPAGSGKTTLFNALTAGRGADGVGMVDVPDARLARLAEAVNPAKTTAAQVRVEDTPPGSRAQRIAAAREADVVLKVVRGFGLDPDPGGDLQGIELDLALTDLATVERRLEIVAREVRAGRKEAEDRARDWIKRVGLAGFERYYPHQLSGGMRKRAALAQTLINEPRVLMMDEPFSALDVQTRTLRENELLQLGSTSRASVVFVTHDLEEAIALADRVVVITAGPGTVKGTYRVDLPRPRNVAEIRFQPEFSRIYKEIWDDLRDEVLVSYERAKRSVS